MATMQGGFDDEINNVKMSKRYKCTRLSLWTQAYLCPQLVITIKMQQGDIVITSGNCA